MQYAVKYFYLKSFDMDQPQHSSTWKNTSLFEQQDLMLVAVFVAKAFFPALATNCFVDGTRFDQEV